MAYFILGRSGSGKSELLHRYIKEMPEGKNAVLIVPEQSSFQNEKKLLDNIGAKKAKFTEVLSFKRLCDHIFDQYKGITEQRIDDGIKAVLMSMAIENAPAEGGVLELYKSSGKRNLKRTMDLVEPMLVAVNEYKMCLITPEQLSETAKTVENKVLAAKLRDSARIYAAYNALLENSYADPDDDLTKLYDILGENNYFQGMYVFIDSFSGFSAQEFRIIERIFSQAEEVYISLCCDRETLNNENSIFAEPDMTYRTLLRLAQKTGQKCNIIEPETEGIRFQTDALKAIEKGIFHGYRISRNDPGKKRVTSENDGSVELYEASDLYDEVSYTAEKIYTLVHEHGYKYSDIEIIARSFDSYKSVIASEFPKYHIPYFLSNPECLENKALIRLMLSAFDVIHSGFDTEAVLRIAKTGLTPLEEEEVFELENYVYVWNIRGKRWKSEFTMSPGGERSDKRAEEEAKETAEIEDVRKRLILPMMDFETEIKNASMGSQISFALYRLMENFSCREKFRSFIRHLQEDVSEVFVEREASVWDSAMAILDKMYHVLGNKKVDSRAYLDLLKIYIRKSPISDIPRTINSVTAGMAGNIRSANPKAVFVLGAVEGIFPAQPGAVGIFTDSERRFLREEQPEDKILPLYEGIYGASLKEKMHVYSALTAPSEKLYVSWYTQSLSGASCEPSVIKSEILSVIPDIEIRHRKNVDFNAPSDPEVFFTQRQSFDICTELWNVENSCSATLKDHYFRSEKYRDRAYATARAADKEPFRLKDGKGIKKLYGDELKVSSTKLDQYAACKFAYFCKFGLEAQPLRRAAMDGGLYGTAMHYIFERILSSNAIDEFVGFDDKTLKEEIKKYLDEYIDSLGDKEERSSRFNAICGKIRKNAFMVLSRMRGQFRNDAFRPIDFELRIGAKNESGIPPYELALPTGEKILVNGFVDRVDTAEINGDQYIRIIDYKTGSDKFELGNIANGIKVQMLLYLSAILKKGTKKYADGKVLLPAGVLYVPSTAKAKSAQSGSENDVKASEKDQNDNFRMRGLLIDDKEVLEKMEPGLGGEYLPASAKKKPPYDFTAASSVVSAKDFESIFRYIDICLKQMGAEVYAGNIEVLPKDDACKYCEYGSICRFENGGKMQKSVKYNSKEAIEKIRKDTGSKKEENNNGSV